MTDNEARFEIERLRLENEALRVQLRKKDSNKVWLWGIIFIGALVLIFFSDSLLSIITHFIK